MTSQSIISIFPVSMVVLWVGLWLLKKVQQKLSRRVLALILLGGVALTAASLLIYAHRYSGTNYLTEYGWPHSWYTRTVRFDQLGDSLRSSSGAINFGPLGSYIWVNVIFYFSVIVLAIGFSRFIRLIKINRINSKNG